MDRPVHFRYALFLLLAGVVLLAGCSPSPSPIPPPTFTPGPRPTPTPPPELIVEYSWDVTPEITTEEGVVLSLTLTNRSEVKINDLDITVDNFFMENFIAGPSDPPARLGQLPHYWNFVFGEVQPGETIDLRITLLPIQSGEYTMNVKLIDLGRAGLPIKDTEGQFAEFEGQVVVLSG